MYFLKLLLTFLVFSSILNAKIILGVVPSEHKSILMKKYLPLAKYLSEKTKEDVELKIGNSYQEIYDDFLAGRVHFALMGPMLSYKAMHKSRYVLPVVRFKKNESSSYRVAIVTSKKSNIKTLREFDSRYFAFGDKMSATTYYIPRYMLNMKGLGLKNFSNYDFFTTQTHILDAIVKNKVDGSAVSEFLAKKYSKYLNIIAYSEPLLTYTICTNLEYASRSQMVKIKKALLKIDDINLLNALAPEYDGFKRASKIEYSKLTSLFNTNL